MALVRGTLARIDRDASTVEIDGRRFPAVALICPVNPAEEADRQLDEHDRALAAGGNDIQVYIPAENGLLFAVEEGWNEHHHGLSLVLYARSCELVRDHDGAIYLPKSIGLRDGKLNNDRHIGEGHWTWADPDWVVETIDRISRLPYEQPDGPLCQLVRLNHFDAED